MTEKSFNIYRIIYEHKTLASIKWVVSRYRNTNQKGKTNGPSTTSTIKHTPVIDIRDSNLK